MAGIARVVAPGMPHHITQRGNMRQQTFFSDTDYAAYPEQWPWSSAVAHITGRDDKLVSVAPVLSIIRGDCSDFLSKGSSEEQDSMPQA